MKRSIACFLLMALLLTGCAKVSKQEQKQYTATFLDLFDTMTSIVGKADSEEAFRQQAQLLHDELLEYHQLFDIYNDYDGLVNLKTVNDQAGITPVTVDGKIIALLKDCQNYYDLTEGRVNVAMGSVLNLWHEAREDGINDPVNAYLPNRDKLEAAAEHTGIENLVIDEENSTVYLTDPEAKLDVGAVAKGWSAQRVCENTPSGLLVSVGGNVCATGPKDETGTPWVVGVQDPDGGEAYLHTLYLTKGSIVTSGDYQRAYVVDGKTYHHIIDPDTLYPGTWWRSVTVLCEDSGLADALSTALFLLPKDEGQALLEEAGAEAMWVDAEGNCFYSAGFESRVRT